jgi:hypothetical protein
MIFPSFLLELYSFHPKKPHVFFPSFQRTPQRCRIFGPATARDGWPQPGRMGSIFLGENRRGWDELGWFNPRYMIHIWSISGQYMINIWWFWSLAALIFGWVQSQWRSDLFRKTPVTCSSANGAHVLQREIRQRYPLVNIQKTMENHHFYKVNQLFLWVIFYSYVSLPEGIHVDLIWSDWLISGQYLIDIW